MKRVDRIVSKAQYLPCPSVVNRLMATLKDIFLLLLLTAFFLICYCTAWNWKLINSQKAKGPPKEQCSTADWGGCSTKLDLTYYLGARLGLYDSRHFKKKKNPDRHLAKLCDNAQYEHHPESSPALTADCGERSHHSWNILGRTYPSHSQEMVPGSNYCTQRGFCFAVFPSVGTITSWIWPSLID